VICLKFTHRSSLMQRFLGDHHAHFISLFIAHFANYDESRLALVDPNAYEQQPRAAALLRGRFMPTLTLRIAPLHNPQHYAALAEQLTDLTAGVLHKRREVTTVMIEDLPAARFCVGGLASKQTVAHLSIDITEGTNTLQEKQQFVAQSHAMLTRILGTLHEASYCLVRELPASDWGYGGLTQAQRRAQAAPAAAAAQMIAA
jgi:4-oxalocrotonate tautomerase